MQKEIQTNGSAKQARKSLYLRLDEHTYVIEGHWQIQSGSHHDNATNQQTLHIASDYHADFGPVSHLVHPEDVDGLKRTLDTMNKSDAVDYQFRIITPTARIQTLIGSGRLAREKPLPTSQWNEDLTVPELQLQIFNYAEQASHTGSWAWNISTDRFHCTDNVYKLMGLQRHTERMDLVTFTQNIQLEDRKHVLNRFMLAKQQRQPLVVDFRVRVPHRGIRHIRTKAEPFFNHNGFMLLIGRIKDVTRESLKGARERERELIATHTGEQSLRSGVDHAMLTAHAGPQRIQKQDIKHTAPKPIVSRTENEKSYLPDDRYRTLFHRLEDGFAWCEVIRNDNGHIIDWHFLDVNPAIEKHTGISPAYLTGQRFSETPAHQREWWLDTAARVIRSQQAEKIEHYNTLVNRWEEVTVFPFGPEQFAMVYHDVSEHKEAEDALQKTKELKTFILGLNDVLNRITDPIEIQYEASRKLAQQLDCDNGYYAEMSDDENTLTVRRDYVRGNLPSVAGVYPADAFTQILALSRDGCLAINDVALSSLLSEHEKAMLQSLQVGALLFVGLFKNGKRVANMAIDQTKPRQWKSFEISLLLETAERTWGIMEKNRADNALRKSKARLHTLLHSLSRPLAERGYTQQLPDGQAQDKPEQLHTDHTEFKTIIERQNAYLHNILNAIPQMLWVLDAHGKITFVNDRWHMYTGITEEQCLDRDARKCNIFHPGQQRELADKWEYLFGQKKRYIGEVLVKDTNGSYRWHLDITEPILDDHGNIEMWIGSFTDVNEQFASEKDAKETRDLLQAVFDASASSIIIFDAVHDNTGTITDFETRYSNTNAAQFLDEQNLPHKSLMHILRKQGTPELFGHFRNVMATGKPFAIDYTMQLEENDKWFHLIAVKLEDGIVVTQSDITEQMVSRKNLERLNESLREKNHELKTVNEELANFTFIASHDLREPLRKIRIFASDIIENDVENLSPRSRLFSRKILTAVDHTNDLIEDILTYSRVATQPKRHHAVTDLNRLLKHVLADLNDTVIKTNAIIRTNKIPSFKCNALQMTQLLQNLISNALKFQDGHKKPDISIIGHHVPGETIDSMLASADHHYLKLEITDNGIGFDDKYAEKIFGIFQRLHPRNAYSGLGMGLAICKKVVENHNGFIIAKGTARQGSVFTCYFPIKD